ncbi:MAG: glutamate racemase [Patescibacteria group bacterium]
MPNNKPIGFFDSGIGGISILKEVKKLLPNESTIFIADQKNMPFGTKSAPELKDITKKLTEFLLRSEIKLLVIACNTATCSSLNYLRKVFDIPIIGVVPAVKYAAKITKKSKIAVMSTPGTYKSRYLEKLIKDYGENVSVLKVDCYGLENAIESGSKNKIENLLDKYCAQIRKFDADVAVLGCTHYPLIKQKIADILGKKICVIDSGEAIAKRTKTVIADLDIGAIGRSKEIYYTTGSPKKFALALTSILNRPIAAQQVSV